MTFERIIRSDISDSTSPLSDGTIYREISLGVPRKSDATQEVQSMTNENSYTPDHDVYGQLEDGRLYLKAAKGVPMNLGQAKELGILDAENKPVDNPNAIIVPDKPQEIMEPLPLTQPQGVLAETVEDNPKPVAEETVANATVTEEPAKPQKYKRA